MTVLSKQDGCVDLRLTKDELAVLNNALIEAFEALDGDELETRLGASQEEALRLLNELGRVDLS